MNLFKLFMAVAAALALCRFCHFATDGFRLTKIENNTFGQHEESVFLEKTLLEQPFTYLARGKQSFVFASQDGKVVLKLLNNHYQWNIRLLTLFPSCSWCAEKIAYNRKKMEQTRESYEIAHQQLQEETGTLFLHLAKTSHLKQTVTIIDKLGIAHRVDLDKTAFILQKRATPAYAQLEAWIAAGDLEAAKRGIRSLLDLLERRMQKQIGDKDPLIRTNIGFLEGKALFLDLGPFSKNSSLDPRVETEKITRSLRHFLEKCAPSLALFLEDERMKRVYSKRDVQKSF